MTPYDRADVLRILRITSRQIQGWERAGLIPAGEHYSFFDLLQIKKLRDLSAKRVRSATIVKSLEQMRLASGMVNPLIEAGMVSSGRRLAFRHRGRTEEAVSGQFVLDFVNRENTVVAVGNLRTMPSPQSVAELFARGVALEENPATQAEAIACYQKVVELEPTHAAAQINLGTIFYNRHDFTQAEGYYRKAIESDSRYALAYFDLGNVLDETGRLADAVLAYQTAIMLAPTYADAHYNAALAFEKMAAPRKALPHWRAYLKLDTNGPWAAHARTQVNKIVREHPLRIVSRRRPRQVPAPAPALSPSR